MDESYEAIYKNGHIEWIGDGLKGGPYRVRITVVPQKTTQRGVNEVRSLLRNRCFERRVARGAAEDPSTRSMPKSVPGQPWTLHGLEWCGNFGKGRLKPWYWKKTSSSCRVIPHAVVHCR